MKRIDTRIVLFKNCRCLVLTTNKVCYQLNTIKKGLNVLVRHLSAIFGETFVQTVSINRVVHPYKCLILFDAVTLSILRTPFCLLLVCANFMNISWYYYVIKFQLTLNIYCLLC